MEKKEDLENQYKELASEELIGIVYVRNKEYTDGAITVASNELKRRGLTQEEIEIIRFKEKQQCKIEYRSESSKCSDWCVQLTDHEPEKESLNWYLFLLSVILAPTFIASFAFGFARPNRPWIWGIGTPIFIVAGSIIYWANHRWDGEGAFSQIGLVPFVMIFLTLWNTGMSYLGAFIKTIFFSEKR